MNNVVFVFLLCALGGAYLLMGRNAFRQTKNQDDYFLVGRRLGFWSLAISIVATHLGGGTVVGAAEEAYRRGWVVLCYPLGHVLGLLCLAAGFGAKIRKLNLVTISEIFEKIYGSRTLRKVSSVLSIASIFFVLIGIGIASRKFFCDLGLDQFYIFAIFWIVIVLYTVLGGLKAVVNTDVLQMAFIIGCFVMVLCFTLGNSLALGTSPSTSTIPVQQETIPWVTWLLIPLLFAFIEQDMAQRCFAAKTPRTASAAALIASFVLFFSCLVPIYLGCFASKLAITIPEGSSVLIATVKTVTNPTVTAFFMCAILMAIVSTADSLLCSISSNVCYDLAVSGGQSMQGNVRFSQVVTFLIGMAAFGVSLRYDNIVSVYMISYELAVSVLFVPIVMAVTSKNPKIGSATLSMLCGLMCFMMFRLWIPPIPKEVLTLCLSYGGFWLGQKLPRYGKLGDDKEVFQKIK